MTPHPARDCSEEAIAVFEQIAINNDQGHARLFLDELLDQRLIEENHVCLTSYPPQYRTYYRVPLSLHYQWCQWASEQPDLDVEEG